HEPVAGLARLDELVEATRAAGLPVDVEVEGEPRELPPSVDTAAYRIIQEALTNTRKHAGPARASVRLSYTDDGIRMRIDDDGAGPSGDRDGGDGIPGMRERAAALGGTLTAGPRPGGGFRVEAHLRTTGGGRWSGCCWWTTRRSCAPGSGRCCRPSRTSRSSARPRTATPRSGRPATPGPTSCSWTSACRAATASTPPRTSWPTRGCRA